MPGPFSRQDYTPQDPAHRGFWHGAVIPHGQHSQKQAQGEHMPVQKEL